jgi:hypothetical protein
VLNARRARLALVDTERRVAALLALDSPPAPGERGTETSNRPRRIS